MRFQTFALGFLILTSCSAADSGDSSNDTAADTGGSEGSNASATAGSAGNSGSTAASTTGAGASTGTGVKTSTGGSATTSGGSTTVGSGSGSSTGATSATSATVGGTGSIGGGSATASSGSMTNTGGSIDGGVRPDGGTTGSTTGGASGATASGTTGASTGSSATGGRTTGTGGLTTGSTSSGTSGNTAGGTTGSTAGTVTTGDTGSTGGATTGGTTGGASGGTGGTTGGTGGAHVGFYVDGRYLYDRCGEKVVLRGINEMVIYSGSQNGTPYFAEMAKTGANSVRITWNTTGSATNLEASIKNAIAAQMIPIPVVNDATGDFSKLGAEVDYWVRSDIVAVIKKYQDKLIVNIGNEVGDGNVSDATFTSGYKDAIVRMRNAGIHTPLVIDGSSWGQNIDQLQSQGPGLESFDPDHNLLFSVHMYWDDPDGTRVNSEISQSVNMNLPLIVGEFAQHAVSGCSSAPFAYKVLLADAKTSEIGYLPWSWGGVKNSDCANDQPFDMTSNGTYNGLQGWGKEVAVTDPNSIQNTSTRPKYMTTGSCN